jgi:purine nucleoside phosphorylase
LRPGLEVGRLVVPDDYFCPFNVRRVYRDYRGHYLPVVHEDTRAALLDALHEARLRPHAGGTYVTAAGPRVETKSEIRFFAQ